MERNLYLKRFLVICFLSALPLSGCYRSVAEEAVTAPSKVETIEEFDVNTRTQVIIVGTIHKRHYSNAAYSSDVLRDIILSLEPDAILNELPLSLVEPDGRPLERIRGKGNSGGPEAWVSDTVAQQLGIKQIPFDRPDREENFHKTGYFEKQKRANELERKCGEYLLLKEPDSLNIKIAKLRNYAGQAETSMIYNAGPEVINSQAHDSVIRIKKSLWYEIIPEILSKYPESPECAELVQLDHFFEDQWNKRNEIMAENIVKAAKEYPGKRLVVITGATHRYILLDLLKNVKSIELKEYWEVKDMLNNSNLILHIMRSEDWQQALNEGYYRPDSLDTVGYIHCSNHSQILRVANHKFKGQDGLVLLFIDPEKVTSEVKWEGYDPKDVFPHIYGALNPDAVVEVRDFLPSADGTFEMP